MSGRLLSIPLQLRDLAPTKTGLSFPRSQCEEEGWEYPCYVARGRYDDGSYVSVEHSNAYSELTPDRYLVVVASGGVENAAIARAKEKAREVFPDTHARVVQVCMGSIH